MLANAQNRICFHVADEDARVFATKGSGLEAEDFASLGAYEFYARLVAQSAIQPWCSGSSLPPAPSTSSPEMVKDASRQAYGRLRSEIETETRELTHRRKPSDQSDIGPRPRSGGAS